MGKAFLLFVYFLLFLLSANPALAKIELSFSQPPEEIEAEQSFSIMVTLSGATEGNEYYIRGAFFPANTSNYFGFTKNNDGDWQNSPSNFSEFFKVSGNGEYQIEFKPDPTSSSYSPELLDYLFTIGRYTPGGSLSWSEQSPATIHITSPPVTVTPENTTTPVVPKTSIKLSEVYACPESGDAEWVEIMNTTDQTWQLENWRITDDVNKTRTTFSQTLQANQFIIIENSASFLNNTGDQVLLINEAGEIIDQTAYTDCSPETSWSQINGSWRQTWHITSGTANILKTPSPTAGPTVTQTSTPKPTATSKPSLSASPTTTNSPTVTITNSSQSALESSSSGTVLGITASNSAIASSSSRSAISTNIRNSQLFSWILIIGGSCCFLGVGLFFLHEWYNTQDS